MRHLAVINQKGGVGKTTTAANLGAALARAGQRVLLIDLDAQAHLTLHLGVEPADNAVSSYEVLTETAPLSEAILELRENLFLVPAHTDLVAAESRLLNVVGREVILRDALAQVRDEFDFLLIDCPPSLGVLTLNALAAASEVIIPLQPHFLALQGLAKLLETVMLVQARINPDLRVEGVVVCLQEAGTRLAGEVIEDVRQFLDAARDQDVPWSEARVFDVAIRRTIKLAECPGQGQTVFDYAPRCNGAQDYAALADELLNGPVVEAPPGSDAEPEAADRAFVESAAEVARTATSLEEPLVQTDGPEDLPLAEQPQEAPVTDSASELVPDDGSQTVPLRPRDESVTNIV
ncbi:MAG: ParA family protein [bacterium]|nr:ParA family protein [bacterium]